MESFCAESGMSTLTAVLWLTEVQAEVRFRSGECLVEVRCHVHENCKVTASARGGPGAAFVSAAYKAALEHDSHVKQNGATP